MFRKTTRPPTACCTLPMYIGFVLTEPKSSNCSRMAEIMKTSHDSVNRFLLREAYEPKDLFDEAKPHINPIRRDIKRGHIIANCYRLQRDLFQDVIATFIHDFVVGKNHLDSQFLKAVNA